MIKTGNAVFAPAWLTDSTGLNNATAANTNNGLFTNIAGIFSYYGVTPVNYASLGKTPTLVAAVWGQNNAGSGVMQNINAYLGNIVNVYSVLSQSGYTVTPPTDTPTTADALTTFTPIWQQYWQEVLADDIQNVGFAYPDNTMESLLNALYGEQLVIQVNIPKAATLTAHAKTLPDLPGQPGYVGYPDAPTPAYEQTAAPVAPNLTIPKAVVPNTITVNPVYPFVQLDVPNTPSIDSLAPLTPMDSQTLPDLTAPALPDNSNISISLPDTPSAPTDVVLPNGVKAPAEMPTLSTLTGVDDVAPVQDVQDVTDTIIAPAGPTNPEPVTPVSDVADVVTPVKPIDDVVPPTGVKLNSDLNDVTDPVAPAMPSVPTDVQDVIDVEDVAAPDPVTPVEQVTLAVAPNAVSDVNPVQPVEPVGGLESVEPIVEPSAPAKPDVPNTPDNPNKPNTPEQPNVPGTSAQYNSPAKVEHSTTVKQVGKPNNVTNKLSASKVTEAGIAGGVLPDTGDNSNLTTELLGLLSGIMTIFGVFGLKKKEKN